MQRKITVTDAELPIMKVLWDKGASTSPEIYKHMEGDVSGDKADGGGKNKSTFKTLLLRLVQKGAVKAEEINARNFMYSALLSKDDYITYTRRNFLERVFDGSAQKMLLNFIREERIGRDEIEALLRQVEED